MNAVLEERIYPEEEAGQEEDNYVSHEEIMMVTRELIEEHREAYRALANA